MTRSVVMTGSETMTRSVVMTGSETMQEVLQ